MKKYIRRILFYIRYEMTCDVETRIEMGIAICLVLLCLGFAGYRFHALPALRTALPPKSSPPAS